MEQRSLSIAYKELLPIVVAAALWGSQWVSRRVEFYNESVVAVLKSGSSRDQHLMGLVRHLSLLAMCHSFMFTASSARSSANPVADSLSRFQFQRFRLAPQADLTPCVIPESHFRRLDPEVSVSTLPRTRAFHSLCSVSLY